MVEARKGYIVCLEKLLYFDERRQLQSRQSLQTVLKKLVQFCNANEKEALWEKCMASETEVNSKWKELHPGSSAPFPYTILLMIDKDGMSIKDVCKKYNVGKTKLHEMLRFARERTDDVVRRHKNRYPTPSLIEDAEKCDTSM
jgi:hypothetical protein